MEQNGGPKKIETIICLFLVECRLRMNESFCMAWNPLEQVSVVGIAPRKSSDSLPNTHGFGVLAMAWVRDETQTPMQTAATLACPLHQAQRQGLY